jgi:hypothetical protein
MNAKDVMIFIGVAAAAYLLLMRRGAAAATGTAGSAWTTEINNPALHGQTGYGWRYFSDGTAISPTGAYYKQGRQLTSGGYDGVSVGANYSNLT